MFRCVAVVAVVSIAGCGDAITLAVDSDRPVPQAIDAICVGIADTSLGGGQFGRHYPLVGNLARLPQTLRVDAGDAGGALAWVRADRGGVPVLRAAARTDFADDVTLSLPRCQVGRGAALTTVGNAVGPVGALLAASQGQGGALVLAIGPDGRAVLAAKGESALAAGNLPAEPSGPPAALITADVDGDCDDDAIVSTGNFAPQVWERDGSEFFAANQIGSTKVSALAALDVEHDGDIDLVLGDGALLQLWLNDGGGSFTHAPQALSAGGRASAISALAVGDIDGDGNADLVVGQAGPPLAAWLGKGGTFEPSDGVLPAAQLDVERLTLADADGDFDPDLGIAIRGMPMRLLINREGRLEDQSFLRLPRPPPVAHAIAFGGWDAGCEPDAIIAADEGAPTLKGVPGKFEAETPAPSATDVVMVDIDSDGDLDAVVATPDGARWLAR